MTWVEVFIVFVMSHLVGDYLLADQLAGPAQARRLGAGWLLRTLAGRCSPT